MVSYYNNTAYICVIVIQYIADMELRIKEILKDQGITNISLADQVGITRPNMSNIVNGKTKPSLDTLERIADALQVPISDLFEQPQQNIITCPHCNGKIKVSKEEQP